MKPHDETDSFIHSRKSLSSCYVSGTILITGGSVMNETNKYSTVVRQQTNKVGIYVVY